LTEALWTGQVVAGTAVQPEQPTPGVIQVHLHGHRLLQEIVAAEAEEEDNIKFFFKAVSVTRQPFLLIFLNSITRSLEKFINFIQLSLINETQQIKKIYHCYHYHDNRACTSA
jgi:hypothetical protein